MSRLFPHVEVSLIDCCSPLVRPTLTPAQTAELEQLFKAIADRHRVQILNLLAGADEAVCVCKLMPALGLAQPTVSYHLKLLIDAGLLSASAVGVSGTTALRRVRSIVWVSSCGPNPRCESRGMNVLFVCVQNAGRSQLAEASSVALRLADTMRAGSTPPMPSGRTWL